MSGAVSSAGGDTGGLSLSGAGAARAGVPNGNASASGTSCRLTELKGERDMLRQQLSRLQAARAELEAPGRQIQEFEAEVRTLHAETASAISAWVSGGCRGARPASDPARVIARRAEAARQALNANAARIGEIDRQMVTLRHQLADADGQIAGEIAVVLGRELEADLAQVQIAADDLNAAISRVMGLRAFLIAQGRGNPAFQRLAERIQHLKTPAIGSTRDETASAAASWARRFEEMTK
jgi:hypothetical protein